jgi:hypothetical protein
MREPLNSTDDIEITEQYDPEDDIYYVSMNTLEPSFAQEIDDRLLVEFGIFSNLPTGFRIFNYSKYKAEADTFKIDFKERCKAAGLHKLKSTKARQLQVERRIDKFFEAAGV